MRFPRIRSKQFGQVTGVRLFSHKTGQFLRQQSRCIWSFLSADFCWWTIPELFTANWVDQTLVGRSKKIAQIDQTLWASSTPSMLWLVNRGHPPQTYKNPSGNKALIAGLMGFPQWWLHVVNPEGTALFRGMGGRLTVDLAPWCKVSDLTG